MSLGATDEVRSFNRFYTRAIGLLNAHLPESRLSLAEARVLYEIAHGEGTTAAAISRRLAMDKAHLSRIVARFRTRGLVHSHACPDHGKRLALSLTGAGRTAFSALDQRTCAQIDALLEPLDPDGRRRLVSAMHDIRTVLDVGHAPSGGLHLRGLQPGDLGWIVHRQALLYHREYGWDWSYEALVARILGDFVAGYDEGREDAWVAEHLGAIVGSVFLVKSTDAVEARLRLLYVEPAARGLGIGRSLVDRCIARAREIGYRRMTLWTNDVLVAARRIYQAAGFRLVEEAPHRSFGHDLIGQTWTLDLAS